MCVIYLQAAEEQLKKEANLTDIPDNVPVDSDVSSVLAAYKSEGDPDLYEYAYLELRRFVDESLDIYKVITWHFWFIVMQIDRIVIPIEFLQLSAWTSYDTLSRVCSHVSRIGVQWTWRASEKIDW